MISRLSDLYQAYGINGKEARGNAAEESNKSSSRYGKPGDIYSLVSEMTGLVGRTNTQGLKNN